MQFRGQAILIGVLREAAQRGLGAGDTLVLSGCSAGATRAAGQDPRQRRRRATDTDSVSSNSRMTLLASFREIQE